MYQEDPNREMRKACFGLLLNDYQIEAEQTAVYPREGPTKEYHYCALGLAGEAGEVANKVKKVIRDDGGVLTDKSREAIKDELGDVLWYTAMLAKELGYGLQEVAEGNLAKLKARHSTDKSQVGLQYSSGCDWGYSATPIYPTPLPEQIKALREGNTKLLLERGVLNEQLNKKGEVIANQGRLINEKSNQIGLLRAEFDNARRVLADTYVRHEKELGHQVGLRNEWFNQCQVLEEELAALQGFKAAAKLVASLDKQGD